MTAACAEEMFDDCSADEGVRRRSTLQVGARVEHGKIGLADEAARSVRETRRAQRNGWSRQCQEKSALNRTELRVHRADGLGRKCRALRRTIAMPCH